MNARFKRYGAALTTAGLSLASSVHAAVPTEVTTAVTEMGTDAKTVAGIVLVAIIGVMAIKFIRRGM